MEPEIAQRVRHALKEGIDWNYLVETALYHGTIPLLFLHLSRLSQDEVPQAILSQLKDYSNRIARWNLSSTGALLKLLGLCRERGIRAIPLKGPVLAATAYGNLFLRHFCDLDILVSKQDMLKAKEVLVLQGYHPTLEFTAIQETAYVESHHDYKFVRSSDNLAVDLQWGITQWSFGFPFDFEDAWNHRETISLAGAPVQNLGPEILLLQLCVHGTKHRWEQLKWICDIAQLVDAYREKLDWDRFLNQARLFGGERMLMLGLFLAHSCLGTVLSAEALRKIHHEPHVERLADNVSKTLFRDGSGAAELRDDLPFFFYWKSRERSRDKLALLVRYFPVYFWRMVVPNKKDHDFLKLPAFLAASYYLIRPARLAWEYWFDRFRRLRG